MEGQVADKGLEVHGESRATTDQGGGRGMRKPSSLTCSCKDNDSSWSQGSEELRGSQLLKPAETGLRNWIAWAEGYETASSAETG